MPQEDSRAPVSKKRAQARSDIDFSDVEAWDRFEKAVDIATHTSPMHRVVKPKSPKRARHGANKRREHS